MSDKTLVALEEKIRSAPWPAAGIIFLGGLLISRLPILGLIAILGRVVFSLIRPAFLIFGVIKVIEFAKKRAQDSAQLNPSE